MIAVNDKIRAKVDALPDCPGVYRWKDKDGKIIYVGKAVNLKIVSAPMCGRIRTAPRRWRP